MSDVFSFSNPEDPPTYPSAVVDSLLRARRRGESFEGAWDAAMRTIPIEAGWGRVSSTARRDEDSGESPLSFLKRHCRAAWHNEAAQQYCANRKCARLAALHTRYCSKHSRPKAEAA